MNLRLVLDMNLSPDWVTVLTGQGFDAIHWSTIGDPHAPDTIIMDWARSHGYVVFTHDLDFGTALALTHVSGPSVIQVRAVNMLPEELSPLILASLRKYERALLAGALIVIDPQRTRVRVLPL